MKREIKARLIEQGIEILSPFFDVSKWRAGVEECTDCDCEMIGIIFTNENRKKIMISDVFYDEDTGNIIQYGENSGYLVL